MKPGVARVLKWVLYPLFYLVCLALFGYLTFPFDDLKGRIISEFDRRQQKSSRRGASLSARNQPIRLEIQELDGYWFSGVEVTKARLIFPPKDDKTPITRRSTETSSTESPTEEVAKPSVLTIDSAHARLRLLPLLLGQVKIDFAMETLGGEISGTVPYGTGSGDVEVELEGVQLGQLQPLHSLVGIPIQGTAGGTLRLSPKEGKFSKAGGELDVTIKRVIVGDGKSELKGIVLPAAAVGDITLAATAKDGMLKIEEIHAAGRDFELRGEGRIRIREPFTRASVDLYLMFKFTDAYRNRNDNTRSLLGEPGSKRPALIEFDSKVKRSKRTDGFYGWHVHGRLDDLKFDPAPTKGGQTRTRPSAKRSTGTKRDPVSARVKKLRETRTAGKEAKAIPPPKPADDAPPAGGNTPPPSGGQDAEEKEEDAPAEPRVVQPGTEEESSEPAAEDEKGGNE